MSGPITYTLPDLAWEILLGPILRDAPVASAIEVYTVGMYTLVEQRITEAGRGDIAVRLVDVPAVSR